MNYKKGAIITLVIVWGSIFFILLGSILNFVLFQLRQSERKLAFEEALEVAEAGINYYAWCVNNEAEANCSLEKDYYDPEGNLVGHFSLLVNSGVNCGQTISRTILSTGWTNKFPDIKRKIQVIYARPSVANYSYVLNSNVWIGPDHEIRGPYHSNGGIRMDGENQSLVTSQQQEWICTSSFGCSTCPTSAGCRIQNSKCYCPGVFTTANGNPGLFSYPVTPFDFAGLTIDLAQLKTSAQTSGIYLPPSLTINPQGKGYHIKIKDNGTLEAWIITGLSRTYAYSLEEGWHYDYFTISNEYLYNTYPIPSACSAAFVEDNIWVEGTLVGPLTLASANLINPNLDTDVILPNSIEYKNSDGNNRFFLIGERNVLIGPQSPNIMELHGIFVAQKGRFSRNHYPGNIRESLEIVGSVVSSGRVGTQWVSGSQIVSGYKKRETYFDSNLVYNSPPFTPYIEPDFRIIKWEEQ